MKTISLQQMRDTLLRRVTMVPNEVIVIAEELFEEFEITSEESIQIAWRIYNKLQFCNC